MSRPSKAWTVCVSPWGYPINGRNVVECGNQSLLRWAQTTRPLTNRRTRDLAPTTVPIALQRLPRSPPPPYSAAARKKLFCEEAARS